MGDSALHHILPRVTGPLEVKKYANFLCALRSRRQRSDRVDAKPIDMTIDFTTTCQLHCPYCAVGNGTMVRGISFMQPAMFAHIVRELGDTTFITWYFSTGEPLLHKKFGTLLSLTKEKQIFGAISTNLSLPLSDERIDDILLCGLSMISVSLDGANQETYSRYRVGGQYNLVMDNLGSLIARKKQFGLQFPLLEWRFLIFRHNEHEIDTARTMAKNMGVDLLEFYPGFAYDHAAPDQVAKMSIPMPAPYIQGPVLDAAEKRTDTSLRALLHKTAFAPPQGGTPVSKCDWLYYSAMIYPDASFGPCCVATDHNDDFTNLGEHETFLGAWNSEKFIASRKAFRENGKAGTVCDRCPLPPAQHYQFVQKVRAILLNAPDWVLHILHTDMERYFFDVDATYLPHELGGIRTLTAFDFDPARVAAELCDYAREANMCSAALTEMTDCLKKGVFST